MNALMWDKGDAGAERKASLAPLTASAVFLSLTVARLAIQYLAAGALYLEDDAYYYTVIAHHIAHSGVSTFDGQTLTNGYHPLWLLVLVLQDLTVGPSIYVTIAIELALATVGIWLVSASFRTQALWFRVLFGVAAAIAARPFVAKGMEVSALIFAIGVFTFVVVAYRNGRATATTLGLAAGLCIGARIDSAVFVLPVLLLVSGSLRAAVSALVPVVVIGVAYAGINLAVFGMAFPISGAVKSIGGLQVNWRLLHQLALEGDRAGHFSPAAFAGGSIGRCIVCFALCLLALPITAPGSKGRLLAAGFIVGSAAFAAKLMLGSSWVIWVWYAFPALIGIVALFHVADDLVADRRWTIPMAAQAVLATLLILGAGWQLRAGASRILPNFELINRQAVAELAPTLQGARVAMGDRAGSFADAYAGPVTQLEGLVNDTAWLTALRNNDDVKPLLCARGVRFVVSYQQDLADYRTVTIPIIRPGLTTFKSPTLTFDHADEVGRVYDLSKFDNRDANDEGDNYLYAWRLSGCDVARR